MSPASYVLGIVASVIALATVIELLRRKRLRERHAIWWFIAGVLALVVGVFPQVLSWAADLLGIEVPTNLVFFVAIAILFFVCLQHSSELTRLEERVRDLAERQAAAELANSNPSRDRLTSEPTPGPDLDGAAPPPES